MSTDTAEANLRWAGNSLTTNGQMRRLTMVVIAIADIVATAEGDAGTAAVSVRGAVTGPDDVAVLVRAAEMGEADPWREPPAVFSDTSIVDDEAPEDVEV